MAIKNQQQHPKQQQHQQQQQQLQQSNSNKNTLKSQIKSLLPQGSSNIKQVNNNHTISGGKSNKQVNLNYIENKVMHMDISKADNLNANNNNNQNKQGIDDDTISLDEPDNQHNGNGNHVNGTNKASDSNMSICELTGANDNANEDSCSVESFSLDDDSRGDAVFRFEITEFSKFKDSKESRLSPVFKVRNLPWRILTMVKQQMNRDESHKTLGFFLQCNAENDSPRWSIGAYAEMRILHTTDPEKNYVKKIHHYFYNRENDWGYAPFITIKDLIDPDKGYFNVESDTVTLEVSINAEAPHGIANLWDSKKLTGFVGLTNQGATCYMNSLLQTLYFTNKLRKAVYSMPTENDDTIKSVPFALQRVFYDLQFSDKSVGTKKLTRSFGWETLDTFMQHDVQELCRVLLDNIENKMKGTNVDGIIPKLFEGKMISYVKCKNVDYESRRTEGFYDIQLNIKGKKDIYESFKDYVTVETLEGENKYDAGKYGLQDAQKGVVFELFPPVLHLHLMRFQYDPQTDSNIKINDRYEFFETINLDEFLENPEATPACYLLHAVLVHSGDNHGGHYVVFINPKLDGKWYKFDDDVVSRCCIKDAVQNNFGGLNSEEFSFRQSTNAYMLVYIRDSFKSDILEKCTKLDIPTKLHERLLDEKRLETIRKRERSEAPNYLQLNIILQEEFVNFTGADLYDATKVDATKQLKVRKTDTVLKVKQLLSETFNRPIDAIRIWPIVPRNNNTTRPTSCIDIEENLNKTISEVSKQDSIYLVYVELAEYDANSQQSLQHLPLQPYNSKDDVILFFKYYNPSVSQLKYVFHMCFSHSTTLNDVQEKINRKMKFASGTELLFFEEVRMQDIKVLGNHDWTIQRLAEQQLLDGDIYIFQINEKENLQKYKLPTVVDYFRDLSFKVEITFSDKNSPNDDGFTLTLSLKMKYDEFAKCVGEHLNYDHMKLQFFKATSVYDLKGSSASQAIKYSPEYQLKDAFTTNKNQIRKLFYQKLNIKITELDERRSFKCIFLSSNLKLEKEIVLLPLKKGLVRDLFEECRNLFSASTENQDQQQLSPQSKEFRLGKDAKLRLVEIIGAKINRIIKEDLCIDQLENQPVNRSYRLEQVDDEDYKLDENEILIPVTHFTKEIYATFGTPFYLKVKNGEPFKNVKKRIQQKLDVGDKEFSTYRFALISMGTPAYFSDEEEQIFELNSPAVQPWLGIDHANKALRNRNRYANIEKAIKIFN